MPSTARGLRPVDGSVAVESLQDFDAHYVWRFLREHNIDLAARKSWCESNDPEFAAKAADVVGLYIDPPAKAIVLCVDEKPSIQVLERALLEAPERTRLDRPEPRLQAAGHHHLVRGTRSPHREIIAEHSKRRRRVDFLGFMNRVVTVFPDREMHVIIDNLNTHKKGDRWLKKHPNVHFHSHCRRCGLRRFF